MFFPFCKEVFENIFFFWKNTIDKTEIMCYNVITRYQKRNFDITKKELEDQVNNYYNETLNKALEIRDIRINNAKNIVEEISSHLQDLHLNNVNFEITFNKIEEVSFQKEGIDQIDFLISFNKGEPMKPLSKTASGGELSRFMLALKTVLGDNLPMQTKIFDEIDSGLSGNIATVVANYLARLSQKKQIIAVSHLPQICAMADTNIKVEKYDKDDIKKGKENAKD